MREIDVFKKLWKQFLIDEKELGFEKAKSKYLKDYENIDMYKVEKSRIKANVEEKLEEHNKLLREYGAEEIKFNLNEDNIELLVDKAHTQTLSRMNDVSDVGELKNLHQRGALISTGRRVQEISSYINLLLNNEIRNMANNQTNKFAESIKEQVVIVNSIHVPNEKCDKHIGKVYEPTDTGNMPLYHPNCKCTVQIVFEKQDIKNATLITGKDAKEYDKLRSENVRYNRLIRQKRRLGEDTSKLRKNQREVQKNLNTIVDKQGHLTDRQKANLDFSSVRSR